MQIGNNNLKFIGKHYRRGNRFKRLQIGDEVIIHPSRWGRSQAKKSYPAKVVIIKNDGENVVAVVGIKSNSGWKGAYINNGNYILIPPK